MPSLNVTLARRIGMEAARQLDLRKGARTMKRVALWVALCLVWVSSLCGQQGGAPPSNAIAPSANAGATEGSVVPRLINYSGVLKDSSGKVITGSVTLTLSLYAEQEGGPPLWSETQSVQLDDQGHYSLLLGATQPNGLPLDLFTSGEAQWLGVQPQMPAAGEQPRVLLVGMPYALKASDADTLGGLPASAFVQAGATLQAASGSTGAQSSNVPNAQATGPDSNGPLSPSGGGTTNFVPLWTSSSKLGNSVLFQSGTGSSAKVGLNTTTPASTLDVNGTGTVRGTLSLPATGTATSSGGNTSQPTSLQASAFNSSTNAAVGQTFNLQAEPAGNNTSSPSGTLNLLFGSGSSAPAETGLSIASNGQITFAAGQTFPGAGTIAGVTAGTDLTGGGTSGNVTLNLDTTKVPQLTASNSFIGNQSVTGNVTATGVVTGSSFSGSGSGLTNVNAAQLNGQPASFFATQTGFNTFTNQQAFLGNSFYMYTGDPGCGAGFAGIGFGQLSGCNNYAIMGNITDTFLNRPSGGTIHFRENNGDEMTIASGGGVSSTAFAEGRSGLTSSGGGGSSSNGGGGGGVFASGGTETGTGSLGGDGVDATGGGGFSFGGIGVSAIGGNNSTLTVGGFGGTGVFAEGDHAAIESSEVMNLYSGNVVLDASGEAVVQFPDWFQAVNKDFRYQLTAVSAPGPNLYIAQEMENNSFSIAGGKPSMKVSWQVTAVRNDAWEKAHPMQVEVEKPEREHGYYLTPELYGAPPEKSIEWARHPEMMKRIEEQRAKAAAAAKP